uniref:Chaperone protein dnaJ 8, chloroplastic isoform X2 n=1 Tax=Elaeis guineensis var. tenera TaxID=51953 RepID=A0A6J0PMS0_ELAGV|nr:chaperone protein dnaJ 8, chloroplastic isoform X2 [Elaeis guineensis]
MKKAATPSRGIGNGSAGGGGGGGLFSRSPESRRCVRFPARSLPFSGEFATLGLTPSASKSDVKRAYKRLALKYHPDVMRGEKGVQEEEAFKEIKSAYERCCKTKNLKESSDLTSIYELLNDIDSDLIQVSWILLRIAHFLDLLMKFLH